MFFEAACCLVRSEVCLRMLDSSPMTSACLLVLTISVYGREFWLSFEDEKGWLGWDRRSCTGWLKDDLFCSAMLGLSIATRPGKKPCRPLSKRCIVRIAEALVDDAENAGVGMLRSKMANV
ncbi:hypothetical protein B484DRAFT_440455, partial [Ochromonadaceae sp. CCMP2298]